MSNLADLLPAGGGQNNTDFVADGTITSGAPVVLTAAGKAAPIVGTAASIGAATVVLSTMQDYPSVCATSGNQNFAGLNDYNGGAGNTGEGFVLTASGTSVVSSSSSYQYTSNPPYYQSCAYDTANDKVIMVWMDQTSGPKTLKIRIGTISGSGASASISWGTETDITTSPQNFSNIKVIYDPDSGNFIVFWRGGASEETFAWCGTVSGTGVNMGSSSVQVFTGAAGDCSCVYDTGQNKVVFYRSGFSSGLHDFCVGTVTGTGSTATVSTGSTTTISGNTYAQSMQLAYDSTANVVVCVWQLSGVLTAACGTVGSTVTFGSNVILTSTGVTAGSLGIAYDSNANKTIVAFRASASPYYSFMIPVTVSGTTPSGGTELAVVSANSQAKILAYNATAQKVIYMGSDGTDQASFLYSSPTSTLTSTNLLGIASGAISDTATGTINTWGSRNEVQTSLTVGTDYYVQTDGTITTDTGGQLIGQAITATQINIKDYTG